MFFYTFDFSDWRVYISAESCLLRFPLSIFQVFWLNYSGRSFDTPAKMLDMPARIFCISVERSVMSAQCVTGQL